MLFPTLSKFGMSVRQASSPVSTSAKRDDALASVHSLLSPLDRICSFYLVQQREAGNCSFRNPHLFHVFSISIHKYLASNMNSWKEMSWSSWLSFGAWDAPKELLCLQHVNDMPVASMEVRLCLQLYLGFEECSLMGGSEAGIYASLSPGAAWQDKEWTGANGSG